MTVRQGQCAFAFLRHMQQVTEEVTVGFLRRAWGLGSGNGGGN